MSNVHSSLGCKNNVTVVDSASPEAAAAATNKTSKAPSKGEQLTKHAAYF